MTGGNNQCAFQLSQELLHWTLHSYLYIIKNKIKKPPKSQVNKKCPTKNQNHKDPFSKVCTLLKQQTNKQK